MQSGLWSWWQPWHALVWQWPRPISTKTHDAPMPLCHRQICDYLQIAGPHLADLRACDCESSPGPLLFSGFFFVDSSFMDSSLEMVFCVKYAGFSPRDLIVFPG